VYVSLNGIELRGSPFRLVALPPSAAAPAQSSYEALEYQVGHFLEISKNNDFYMKPFRNTLTHTHNYTHNYACTLLTDSPSPAITFLVWPRAA
jgi:hypothetical protein